jgi:uncharacterized protein (DUF305 family)
MNSVMPHHQDVIAMARIVQNDAPPKEVRDVPAAIIIAQQSNLKSLRRGSTIGMGSRSIRIRG